MKRIIIPVILLAVILTGCQPACRSSSFFAMDTVMELSVYGDEKLLSDAEAFIHGLDSALSVTDPESQIYSVNENLGGTLSGDAEELLQKALGLCRRTDGALDISVYPAVRAWGFTTGEHRVPESDELSAIAENTDYEKVAFDPDTSSVSLSDGMAIDLGSVAKGYASQKIAESFKAEGVRSALINLGGNVQAVGSKPDGSDWRVGVRDPLSDGNLGVVAVSDKAVVTSGGYERYFVEDGKTYWHIMDPATASPVDSGLVSVTVVGNDGFVCDGLSTALFVMGLDKASQFWRESSDFEAIFVTTDGEIFITEGLKDSFTPLDNYKDSETAVISRD